MDTSSKKHVKLAAALKRNVARRKEAAQKALAPEAPEDTPAPHHREPANDR